MWSYLPNTKTTVCETSSEEAFLRLNSTGCSGDQIGSDGKTLGAFEGVCELGFHFNVNLSSAKP
jgi:hypothetical protein